MRPRPLISAPLAALLAILCLLVPAGPAPAADVTFNLANFLGNRCTNRTGYLEYLDAGGGTNNVLITFDKLPVVTDPTNGSFTVLAIPPGTYHLQIAAPPATSDFYFGFPLTNGAINALGYLISPTNQTYPPGSTAYAVSVSDARYQAVATNAPGTAGQVLTSDGTNGYFAAGSGGGMAVAAGTNTTAVTNGSLVTLSVPSGTFDANGAAAGLALAQAGFVTNRPMLNLLTKSATAVAGHLVPKLLYSPAPTKILYLGDSTMENGGIYNPRGGTIPGSYTQIMKNQYGNAGSGNPSWLGGTPSAWVFGGRPEGIYLGQSICLYASDGIANVFTQPTDPTAVPVTSVRLYYVASPIGGTITSRFFSSLGGWSITNTLAGYASASTVLATNVTIPASSDATLQVLSMTGTNIFLDCEFLRATNAPGIAEYYYSYGGTTLAQMLAPGSNVLATYFGLIQPDLVLFQGKHFSGVASFTTLTNQLTTIFQAVQSTCSNATIIPVLTYPRLDSDAWPANADTAFNDTCIYSVAASLNLGLVDIYSGYNNSAVNQAAGLYYDGIHPNALGSMVWAGEWYRQMGFVSGWSPVVSNAYNGTFTGNGGGLTNLPSGNGAPSNTLTATVTISTPNLGPLAYMFTNGYLVGTSSPAFGLPAGPTLWYDATYGVTTSGTNLSVWANKGTANATLGLNGGGASNASDIVTNGLNWNPVFLGNGNAIQYAPTVSRDWLVDTTNHTDETMIMVVKVNATGGGIWNELLPSSDGAGQNNSWHIGDANSFASPTLAWKQGTNVLTATFYGCTNWNILRFTRQGTNMQMYANGVLVSATNAAGSVNATANSLSLGNLLNLSLAEAANWPRALGAYEIQQFESYLGAKWLPPVANSSNAMAGAFLTPGAATNSYLALANTNHLAQDPTNALATWVTANFDAIGAANSAVGVATNTIAGNLTNTITLATNGLGTALGNVPTLKTWSGLATNAVAVLAAPNTFTASNVMSGGLSVSGGLTINGNAVIDPTSGTFTLDNGLTINSGTMSGNASGLTNLTPVGSPLLQRTLWNDSIVANSGTSETLISSNQIPAGALPVGGQISYTLFGTNDSFAGTRTLKIYGGASSAVAATLSTVSKAWVVRITFCRISTSVVDCFVESTMGSAQQATQLLFTDTGNWGTTAQLLQATITSTGATGDINVRSGKAILIP